MSFKHVLIALTCAAAFPAMALAQSPAWTMAAKAECCAASTDDGSALAAAVLLPPLMTLPADARADALAAAALLPPAPAAACCGAMATPAVDHSAHLGTPAAKAAPPAPRAMGDMACCAHDAGPGTVKAGGACCQDMKDGAGCKDCGMPCCQSMPPTR